MGKYVAFSVSIFSVHGYKTKVETMNYMHLFYSAMRIPHYISLVTQAEEKITERLGFMHHNP